MTSTNPINVSFNHLQDPIEPISINYHDEGFALADSPFMHNELLKGLIKGKVIAENYRLKLDTSTLTLSPLDEGQIKLLTDILESELTVKLEDRSVSFKIMELLLFLYD